jgi:hypothetical protein
MDISGAEQIVIPALGDFMLTSASYRAKIEKETD